MEKQQKKGLWPYLGIRQAYSLGGNIKIWIEKKKRTATC
jgi:hypothetical protein